MGVGRDGRRKTAFHGAWSCAGNILLIAEGAHGSLAKKLIARFGLANGREPQKYGLGLRSCGGSTRRCIGRASSSIPSVGRSTMQRGAVRFSITSKRNSWRSASWSILNYSNPTLSPFEEFQRFKTHPMIAPLFKGGEPTSFGARAIAEGGWQSVPKLGFPGGALVGCSAGFVNVPRIKGSHNAIFSGMLAAEHVVAAH